MTDDVKSTTQPFLARWSQKKQEARAAPAAVAPVDDAEKPLPVLPPIEELTPESDYSGFMHPNASEPSGTVGGQAHAVCLRHAALVAGKC